MVVLAESFFKAHLQAQITAALDWNSLQIAYSARRIPSKKTT